MWYLIAWYCEKQKIQWKLWSLYPITITLAIGVHKCFAYAMSAFFEEPAVHEGVYVTMLILVYASFA